MSRKTAKVAEIQEAADLDVDVRGEVLQRIFGVSHETLRRLATDDRVDKVKRGKFNLLSSIRKYIAHLQDVAGGRGGEDAQASLAAERTLLIKEQRLERELKNAALRGEYVRASDVRQEWQSIIGMFRSVSLSLPGRIRADLPHLTAHDIETIDRVIRRTLEDLANDQLAGAGDQAGGLSALPAAAAPAAVAVDRADAAPA